MKLIVRRKIAVPSLQGPLAVEVKGTTPDPQTPLESLLKALSFDARKDGQETGDVLVTVEDGAL